MSADAAISAGVVIAGFGMLWTGWHWIDPVVSLLISAVIIWGTWDLLRESTNLALQAVPRNIEPERVERYFAQLPGVAMVHDLHIWAMSTTETALTVHLVKPDGNIDDEWLQGALKSQLISVPSAQDDSGEYFLTANSKQLKALLASLSSIPKAFSNQQDLSRALKPTQTLSLIHI